MGFVSGTKTQVQAIRQALAQAEGLPRRGVVYRNGVPDLALTEKAVPATYTPGAPGWSDQAVDVPVEAGAQVALEVPDDLAAKHAAALAGRSLLAEADLPAVLRTAVRDRKGQDADGNPRVPTAPVTRTPG